MECSYCGRIARTLICVKNSGKYEPVCEECARNMRKEHIEKSLENVHEPSDFSSWKKGDMSEAFWMHLIRYQKHPNKHSLNIMRTAFLWACHDDHGLSNSFSHALDWCGIDFFEELMKDLPEN